MTKRITTLATIAALLLSICTVVVIAQEKQPGTPQTTSPSTQDMPKATTQGSGLAANALIVDPCGKVCNASPGTRYITHAGKQYGFCDDACYNEAMKDPAAAVKRAEANMAKLMAQGGNPMTAPSTTPGQSQPKPEKP